jgi:hypothetical protein
MRGRMLADTLMAIALAAGYAGGVRHDPLQLGRRSDCESADGRKGKERSPSGLRHAVAAGFWRRPETGKRQRETHPQAFGVATGGC